MEGDAFATTRACQLGVMVEVYRYIMATSSRYNL